jgi:hypothetical protein
MLTLQWPAASLTSVRVRPPAKAWLMKVWRPWCIVKDSSRAAPSTLHAVRPPFPAFNAPHTKRRGDFSLVRPLADSSHRPRHGPTWALRAGTGSHVPRVSHAFSDVEHYANAETSPSSRDVWMHRRTVSFKNSAEALSPDLSDGIAKLKANCRRSNPIWR